MIKFHQRVLRKFLYFWVQSVLCIWKKIFWIWNLKTSINLKKYINNFLRFWIVIYFVLRQMKRYFWLRENMPYQIIRQHRRNISPSVLSTRRFCPRPDIGAFVAFGKESRADIGASRRYFRSREVFNHPAQEAGNGRYILIIINVMWRKGAGEQNGRPVAIFLDTGFSLQIKLFTE